jgi:hypothetical protein
MIDELMSRSVHVCSLSPVVKNKGKKNVPATGLGLALYSRISDLQHW